LPIREATPTHLLAYDLIRLSASPTLLYKYPSELCFLQSHCPAKLLGLISSSFEMAWLGIGMGRQIVPVLVFVAVLCSGVDASFNRYSFPKDFIFGTGSAAYQVIHTEINLSKTLTSARMV
jgi:hypothetical protein